jgi:MOSC domain-containing protein YiiM
MTGRLLAVNVVHAIRTDRRDPVGSTAIDKRPVGGPVAIGTLGLAGDRQCDPAHGGVDQAVYAYASEDAAFWAQELGREVPPGSFGENLTTVGVDITNAVIGEQWQVGAAVLQVTSPRIPCRNFAGFWDVPDLVKRFTAHGAPGAYLRVLQEGEVRAGDELVVRDRPAHGVTLAETFAARSGDRTLVPRLLEADGLSTKVQRGARDIVRRAG